MEILKFPNQILLTKCEPVTVFGPELKVILDNMWDTMKSARGIGLAANQVGLLYSMFTMEGSEQEKFYIINAEVISKSRFPANKKEGCLSAPGEMLELESRASWIEIKFQDETGKNHTRVFKDIWAVCVQHEMEHLAGESFLESKSLKKEVRKNLAKKWQIRQNK